MLRRVLFCGPLLAIALMPAGCAPEDSSPYARYRLGLIHPQAARETSHLSPLIGIWRAERTDRGRDGEWPEQTVSADWIWFYVLDGHGIQDDWITPPLDEAAAPAAKQSSVRIFDSGLKKWTMASSDGNSETTSTFESSSQGAQIFLVNQSPQGILTRDHFYNITAGSFDWMREWTPDNGQTWTAVTRAHCTRRR